MAVSQSEDCDLRRMYFKAHCVTAARLKASKGIPIRRLLTMKPQNASLFLCAAKDRTNGSFKAEAIPKFTAHL